MEQQTASDGGNDEANDSDEVETHNLKVSADTVVNGLKINDQPGEQRMILFRKQIGWGHGEGVLRDVRGLYWDGEAPPQLRPRAFVDMDHFAYLSEDKRAAREIAEEEGEDPGELAEEAVEIWEDHVRAGLKDEIVVEARLPEETKTVYNIEYVDE